MALKVICIHKTKKEFIKEGVNEYLKRCKKMASIDFIEIPQAKQWKKLPPNQLKEAEGEKILQHIQPNDFLVLLDERGKQFTSVEFSQFLEKHSNQNQNNLVFCIGGAFGFSPEIYNRSNSKLSLSKMTFSHQLIRVLFLEQLYRAFAILNGHPYHNE